MRELGDSLRTALGDLPSVTGTRGRGLMLAADIEGDAPAVARRALLEERLVINATGPHTLRLLPPLVVSEAEIDEALRRLASLLG